MSFFAKSAIKQGFFFCKKFISRKSLPVHRDFLIKKAKKNKNRHFDTCFIAKISKMSLFGLKMTLFEKTSLSLSLICKK